MKQSPEELLKLIETEKKSVIDGLLRLSSLYAELHTVAKRSGNYPVILKSKSSHGRVSALVRGVESLSKIRCSPDELNPTKDGEPNLFLDARGIDRSKEVADVIMTAAREKAKQDKEKKAKAEQEKRKKDL